MMIDQVCVLIFLSCIGVIYGAQWPVPYQRVTSRPPNNDYCQAGLVPFCPSGKAEDAMIYADSDNDTIEIFALKKPVWSFKYGDLMAQFKIMHDALGFRSKTSGRNWTMEWYELDQLFNCTFPHVLENETFVWCDQGALCVYDGIVDNLWFNTSNLSMLKKLGEISGKNYNSWAAWAISDNNTGVYYETWSVYSDPSPNATMYFDSYDCASFVIRGLNQLNSFNASFLSDIHLNYTRINLYTREPELLGTYDQIIQNRTLHRDFIEFYQEFQKRKRDPEQWFEELLAIVETFFLTDRFYFYYNNVYWYLRLQASKLQVTFDEVPISAVLNTNMLV